MNKTTEALKLALEYCDDNMSAEAANVLRMALADHIANTDKMVGCDYCDNPLFAGTKCNNCGRVTLADPVKQEPVIDLSKIRHEDKCCYWDDEAFCNCGADSHEILKWYRKNNAAQVSAKREWVDLTDDEIGAVMDFGYATDSELENAHAVIAAFKDKNK